MKKLQRLLSMLMLSVMMVTATVPTQVSAAAKKLVVHFIDVGQGDAILIQYGNTNSLIDTGVEKKYSQLQAYLKSIKVKNIKNLIVTHPDADHMGSADLVIKNYHVKNVYMTSYTSKSGEYKELISAIKKYKVKRVNVKKGSKIDMGGIKAQVLSANNKAENSNDSSIVLKLVHGKKSFLFTGDISAKVEKQIAAQYNVNVDVLKTSHHGSDTSSAVSFIKETSPEYAVITVGKENNYGHPDSNVLRRLNKYSKKVVRSDQNGTVVITSTGSKLTCKTVATKASSSSTATKPNSSAKPNSSTKPNSSSTNKVGTYVYITKTGKKYHARKCGNGTYTKVKFTDSRVKKLTKCKKCY